MVVAHRPTEWELLLARHGTPGQARFFLEQRNRDVEEIRGRHQAQSDALARVDQAIPTAWSRVRLSRAGFAGFVFRPTDIVAAVGQDGLVPNLAKYLAGQPVLGVNPAPDRYEGSLVRASVEAVADLLRDIDTEQAVVEKRTMVRADLDDGQTLLALNEVFVGHRSHQSSRYTLEWDGTRRRQSSSGLIVATGTGSSGWARSISAERGSQLRLPDPADRRLVFFVREAWPSVGLDGDMVEGLITGESRLTVTSEMEEGGVAFGDGIESDRLEVGWGQDVVLGLADTELRLVRP